MEGGTGTCADTNDAAATIHARPERANIPDTVRHSTKWALALEMIDELATWGQGPPGLVGDAGYGEITAFRQGLTDRGIPYVLAVKAATTAHPAAAVPEAPPRSSPGFPAGRCWPRYWRSPAAMAEQSL